MLINNAFNTTVDFKCGYMCFSTIDLNYHFFCFVANWGKNQVGGIFLSKDHIVLALEKTTKFLKEIFKNKGISSGG